MTKAATKALSRARGTLAALEKNAAKSLDADATKHRADLIVANIHLIEPGSTSVEVDCWETGAKVTIDLTEGSSKSPSSSGGSNSSSPSGSARLVLLDPPDLAALLYRRARKQRRAEEGTAPRRAQAEEAVAFLEGVEARLAEVAAAAAASPSPEALSLFVLRGLSLGRPAAVDQGRARGLGPYEAAQGRPSGDQGGLEGEEGREAAEEGQRREGRRAR